MMKFLAMLLLLSGGVVAQESDCRDAKAIVLAQLSMPGSGAELRVALPPNREALLGLPSDGKGEVLLAQLKRSGESLAVEILESAKIDSLEAMGQAKGEASRCGPAPEAATRSRPMRRSSAAVRAAAGARPR